MQPTSKYLASEMLQAREPVILDWAVLYASGVPGLIAPQSGYPILHSDAAITQATVDAFLGSSSEIAATTAFGSTAMGVDAYGFVINMQGQVRSAVWAQCCIYAATPVHKYVTGQGTDTTVLANTLTQGFAVTSAGNIYGRLIPTGADSSALLMRVSVAVYMK